MKILKNSKISLSILSIVVVCAFIFSNLFSYYTTKKSLIEEVRNSSLPLLSENIYSEIHRSLSESINISSAMAHDSFLINWIKEGEKTTEDIELYLNNINSKYGFFSTFYVSANTGNYYYYDGILKTISKNDDHDVWYYTFLESGKKRDLDVDTDEASNGVLTIFINNRVEDFNGDLLGVAGVGIRLDKIAEKLKEKKEKYNKRVYLIDETGTVQVHSNIDLVEKINIFNEDGINKIAEKLMEESESPSDDVYSTDANEVLVSSRYIPELGWYIIVEQDELSSYLKAKKSLYINMSIIVLITIILFFYSYKIIKNFRREMESLAGTDTLTGASNRREFIKQFNILKYKLNRYKSNISIIMLDIDNFKEINDNYGHLTGDKILKTVTEKITEIIRPVDVLSRWGGDEFIILMEITVSEASAIAERIRKSCISVFSEYGISDCTNGSISAGVSEYIEGESLNEFIKRADNALYRSKEKGKNCITMS